MLVGLGKKRKNIFFRNKLPSYKTVVYLQPLRETPKGNEAVKVAGSKGGVDGSSLKYCGDYKNRERVRTCSRGTRIKKHTI